MKVNKLAEKDAFEFARATMFYGEGAGTRRKLLKAVIDQRMSDIPDYASAYAEAWSRQDMAKHAENARKLRNSLDRQKFFHRNMNAVIKGNRQNLTVGVAVVVTVAYYAHEEGYDKVALEYSKKKYKKAKNWVHAKRIGLHIPDSI